MGREIVASRPLIVLAVALGLLGGLRTMPAFGQDAQQTVFGVSDEGNVTVSNSP